MRFLADTHHLGAQATGNETWAAEVAGGLGRLIGSSHSDDLLLAVTAGSHPPAGCESVVVGRNSVRRLLWDLPAALRRCRVDAVLVQYTAPASRVPAVVAIHDLSFAHRESRDWIPRLERTRMQTTIRWSAERAKRIIALSNYTAWDLCKTWDIDPDKVVVAHPAVGQRRGGLLQQRGPAAHSSTKRPFVVLVVGNVLPRKNLLVVAEATRELRTRGHDVVLHVVGQIPSSGRAVRAAMERVCSDHVVFSGYTDEAALISAYQRADVFCFPSLYEGFGLPVLEAMTAGVPTIVSDATALPEAGGDAAMVVNPRGFEVWADAIEQVLSDSTLAESMRLRGRAHASRFSWTDTAEIALRALREAAAS